MPALRSLRYLSLTLPAPALRGSQDAAVEELYWQRTSHRLMPWPMRSVPLRPENVGGGVVQRIRPERKLAPCRVDH